MTLVFSELWTTFLSVWTITSSLWPLGELRLGSLWGLRVVEARMIPASAPIRVI